jgi:hypothetical protein
MEFVPREHQDKADACHYIPLNERGDTAISLREEGEEALHAALHSWLQDTIARLESQIVPDRNKSQRILNAGEQRACLMLAPAKLAAKS